MGIAPVLRMVDQTNPGMFKTTPFAAAGIAVFYKIRQIWYYVRPFFELFSFNSYQLEVNADYAKQKFVGYMGFCLAGSNKYLIAAARATLATSSIYRCAEKRKTASKAYQEWKKFALKGDYQSSTIINISLSNPSFLDKFLGPTATFWTRLNWNSLLIRLEKIVVYSASLIKEIFLLCMSYADLFDAFSLDAKMNDRAVIDLLVNFEHVANSKESLVNFLKKHEKTIDQVSYMLNLPPAATIIGKVQVIVETGKTIYDGAKKIARVADGEFVENMQQGVSALLITSGFAGVFGMPNAMVPKKNRFANRSRT